MSQRYQIEALLQGHRHINREISLIIEKNKSVLSRELKRNSYEIGVYTGKHARETLPETEDYFEDEVVGQEPYLLVSKAVDTLPTWMCRIIELAMQGKKEC